MDARGDHPEMHAGVCTRCGAASGAGARFCMACGSPLRRSCKGCGASAHEQARFCVFCGAQLEAAPGGVAEGAPGEAAVGERRTVTVLFADIAGYTTISERLDHESVKILTDRCLQRLAREVERFGGYVDQYIGDNVMAVFGAPLAHENDAERAVRTACAMHAAMIDLSEWVKADFGFEIALRIGVNTGEVLAGRVGHEYTVVGDAVNVAARLQGAAEVGHTLVGERTRRATAARVGYRQVGPLALKGKQKPVSAWEVTELQEAVEPASAPRARVPLVGREGELAQLIDASERAARERSPQRARILGEAGVGKSRLVRELEQRLSARLPRAHFLCGRADGFGSEALFGPLVAMLRAHFRLNQPQQEGELVEQLAGALRALAVPKGEQERAIRRLTPLISLLEGGAHRDGEPRDLDGESARAGLFAAVRALVELIGHECLPVLVWEDAQWADEGTLELIDHLAAWVEGPLLQICVHRATLSTESPEQPRETRIWLSPLGAGESLALIDALVSERVFVASEQRDLLARRTGGNPLFAEALVDSLAEGEASSSQLPETVQGLLASRLDALAPPERQLLLHASVLGATFSVASLQSLAAPGDAAVGVLLGELTRRNLIRPLGLGGEAAEEFTFEHMLVREVAYEMLPKLVRARKHAAAAEELERQAGVAGDGSASVLAEHYSRAATLGSEVHLGGAELAGLRRSALEHGISAADAAAALFSNEEALARYGAAAAFADPDDPVLHEIAERCGDIHLRLGAAAAAIEAWERCLARYSDARDAERAAEMHRRIAAALVQQGERDEALKHLQRGINLTRERPPSLALARLFGEAATLYAQVGANMLAAYSAERALSYAEAIGEPRAASRAHTIHGLVFGRIGDVPKARQSHERAVELVRAAHPEETIRALFAAGRNLDQSEADYESARALYREALSLAQRVGEVPSQIELHAALGELALQGCEWEQADRSARLADSLAQASGLVSMLCTSDVLRGRLCWRAGDYAASARLLRAAFEAAARLRWLEVSAPALIALAAALREQGELAQADMALCDAALMCERAALGPQGAEASAQLTLVRMLAGSGGAADEAALQCQRLAAHWHDPVSRACGLEAEGMTALMEREDSPELELAQRRWEELQRPLDAARCMAVRAIALQQRGHPRAHELSEQAAQRLAGLGVGHLAERWRELARQGVGHA